MRFKQDLAPAARKAVAVIVAFWTAVLMAAAVSAPAPAPSSSPLKTIIDIKARTLCATLTEHVQPAIVGLMKNDNLIGYSVSVLNKTASDTSSHGRIDMDMLQLKNVALSLNRNIKTIDDILDDPSHFPLNPKTPDEQSEDKIKQGSTATLEAAEARGQRPLRHGRHARTVFDAARVSGEQYRRQPNAGTARAGRPSIVGD
ncbi:MAG TPA: hypothetical protein VGG89_04890 [Candidatus Baltobacteraceae bacterium]|jgi:hypothetical protein